MENKELSLRPCEDGDIALLARWLEQEYILKWYHDPDDWLAEFRGRHGEYSWIHHFMVMESGVPIGFCQYYDCFDAGDMEDWYTVEGKGDAFSIDYLIGEETRLGKGYGKAIVRLLTETVRRQEQAKRIIVQPDRDNHASNHVLMANGYVYDEKQNYYCKLLG